MQTTNQGKSWTPEATKANGTKRQTDWNSVHWQSAHENVRRLRQRIFRATQEGDFKRVRSLQKLMLRSYANRLVSVRRVTQENAGKDTPGVDKLLVKTPRSRGWLVDHLATLTPWKAKPARRVYIPKANGQLRPLGIPVIFDRAVQAMVKNALEPSWEARFEGTSYGFRPGRGCHDAIEKIFNLVRPQGNKKWILDADIKGAFDNISHAHLLQAIGPVPGRELVKQWLKAGYVERGTLHPTDAGTPQGGVISPLLANIALHGMEAALGVTRERRKDGTDRINSKRAVVRYADDFVVLCESREDAEEAKNLLGEWLARRGLTFSEEKTRIVHITEGFDFLGFTLRHYADKCTRTGYRLLTNPSKASVWKLKTRLRQEWRSLNSHNVKAVLRRLNPIIRGWANYFRTGTSAVTFKDLDNWMYTRATRYTKRMHPTKSARWRVEKYWGNFHPTRKANWLFGDKETGRYLRKFAWTRIERHIQVKGMASPDDPSLREYWYERRLKRCKYLPDVQAVLALRQKGVCPICREPLENGAAMDIFRTAGEETHTHHKQPRSKGGSDRWENLEVVHLYCHGQIHAQMRKRERDILDDTNLGSTLA